MKTLNLLAMDYGASNGRGIVGRFDGEKLQMHELHRFENEYVSVNNMRYWNGLGLYSQILISMKRFSNEYSSQLDGIGIDTWGVDYGLIDANGQLCSNPLSYRMSDDKEMHDVWKIVSKRDLFGRTGISSNNFNTIYQLYARLKRNDSALNSAKKLLLLPDLFAYFLSGESASEYTNSSTTQLYNPSTHDWDREIIKALGLPEYIFQPIEKSCTKRGDLLSSIAEECGVAKAPILSIGSHDTASAVAAVPGHGKFAYISSGTWSLLGIESDEAIINDMVFDANYSNEGTIQGGFRPLKNIVGLWIIQQCRREWMKQGKQLSWDDIVIQAEKAPALVSLIDPDCGEFFATEDMIGSIQKYCKNTSQKIPESIGEISRCVYESLALKYRWALERIEEIRGSSVDALHIVGGGSQNKLLNQMSANAIERPVIAGPVEGACIGNLLGQAMALGEIANVDQLRDIVRASFDVEEYSPRDRDAWQEAYGRFNILCTQNQR